MRDGAACTVRRSENVEREAVQPSDQFEVLAAPLAEGKSIEDNAANFGVSTQEAQRRLKLANVSPRLLANYRAGSVSHRLHRDAVEPIS